jgi:Protein of unknown function (DUF3325)
MAMGWHARQVFAGVRPGMPPPLALRLAGVALLALSLLPVRLADNIAIAVVVWLGLLSPAACMLIAGLSYRPRLATGVGVPAAALGIMLLAR